MKKIWLFVICATLFLIPFLWMRPGEMDIGGDYSRLYFYDPVNYFKNTSLYSIFPEGTNRVESNQFYLPFLLLLIAIKSIVKSPYFIISLVNSLKLVASFLSIYLIVKEFVSFWKPKENFLSIDMPAILAGLFYLSTPAVMANMDKALLSHDQVFLNPLIFYLLLRYLVTERTKYLWIAIGVTLIFSGNFAWFSAPPFFSFYPLAILFLLLYVKLIRHKTIPWRGIIIGIIFMLGIHAFHLIPEAASLLDKGSYTNLRFFDQQAIMHEGLVYFSAVLPLSKLSIFFLLPKAIPSLDMLTIFVPFLVILGLRHNKPEKKEILLIALFFLITFFLISAKITNIGLEAYRRLFYIPGFSMFRNFIGQWQFIYAFFYALLLGLALARVSIYMGKKKTIASFLLLTVILIVLSWKLYDGEAMNKILGGSANVRIVMRMDPKYEQFLSYVRSLPGDGRILMLPFSDYASQVIHGTNNGAYVGPSTISYLAGKSDFSGYNRMLPFSEMFFYLARTKNYTAIKRLLAILNVKYIFYNSDHNVYDDVFAGFPYTYARQSLPDNQKDLARFVQEIADQKIYQNGTYALYLTEQNIYLPQIYAPEKIVPYQFSVPETDPAFLANLNNNETRLVYMLSGDCNNFFPKNICEGKKNIQVNIPDHISFTRINPTKYEIRISGADLPYFLVFSDAFNPSWKAYIKDKTNQSQTYYNGDIVLNDYRSNFFDSSILETLSLKPISEDKHVMLNGYANGWYITPGDAHNNKDYEIILEMSQQRIFYISLGISAITLMFFLVYGAYMFYKRVRFDIMDNL